MEEEEEEEDFFKIWLVPAKIFHLEQKRTGLNQFFHYMGGKSSRQWQYWEY